MKVPCLMKNRIIVNRMLRYILLLLLFYVIYLDNIDTAGLLSEH
jgi:hypothetical protein